MSVNRLFGGVTVHLGRCNLGVWWKHPEVILSVGQRVWSWGR